MARGSVVFPGCPGTRDLLGEAQGLSMAGVRVETALGEVPGYPEVDIFGGFSPLSTQWDLCCLYFLKQELLNGFGVLVGLLPAVSPWSIRSTSGFCCLPLCCVTVGGCWKHLSAALGDGLDEH